MSTVFNCLRSCFLSWNILRFIFTFLSWFFSLSLPPPPSLLLFSLFILLLSSSSVSSSSAYDHQHTDGKPVSLPFSSLCLSFPFYFLSFISVWPFHSSSPDIIHALSFKCVNFLALHFPLCLIICEPEPLASDIVEILDASPHYPCVVLWL